MGTNKKRKAGKKRQIAIQILQIGLLAETNNIILRRVRKIIKTKVRKFLAMENRAQNDYRRIRMSTLQDLLDELMSLPSVKSGLEKFSEKLKKLKEG